jgi:16S rRNA (cytosine967-C5)-methyltransferase
MTSVRVAAARVLLAIEAGETMGAEVDRNRTEIPERDGALLVELTAGTLRWRNELDAILASASQRAVKTIDPVARSVLRLGAYQIRHLDRIPAHAVVHESVESMKALGQPRSAGFVNAVLRTIIRRGPTIALPKRPTLEAMPVAGSAAGIDAEVRYLSVTLSHPAWLVRRWLARVGFEATEAWCQFNNMAPHLTVRPTGDLDSATLLARIRAEAIDAAPAPYVTDAIRLAPGALGRIPAEFHDEMWVQDEGAQLVARLAGVRPGERVLDACAAPGGKTLVMAADLGAGRSNLIAADNRSARVESLARTLKRLAPDVAVVRLDARGPLPFGQIFDCVVLDAPCSGLGTIRRDPDVKWTRTAADLPRLAAEQGEMLRGCASVVKPGGRIVYATCSSEPEENRAVVEAFLSAAPEFQCARPSDRSAVPQALRGPEGWLETRPFVDGLDAYFGAVLERRVTA